MMTDPRCATNETAPPPYSVPCSSPVLLGEYTAAPDTSMTALEPSSIC